MQLPSRDWWNESPPMSTLLSGLVDCGLSGGDPVCHWRQGI
jgi:hypothetical protein